MGLKNINFLKKPDAFQLGTITRMMNG